MIRRDEDLGKHWNCETIEGKETIFLLPCKPIIVEGEEGYVSYMTATGWATEKPFWKVPFVQMGILWNLSLLKSSWFLLSEHVNLNTFYEQNNLGHLKNS